MGIEDNVLFLNSRTSSKDNKANDRQRVLSMKIATLAPFSL